MRNPRLAALGALAILLLPGCASSADNDAAARVMMVTPSKEALASQEQQLFLRGVKGPPGAAGVEVFLNPSEKEKLSPESRSYLGSLYFGHRREGEDGSQDFVLTLHKPVAGQARLVVYLISATGAHSSTKAEVKEAAIKPMDNSAFK